MTLRKNPTWGRAMVKMTNSRRWLRGRCGGTNRPLQPKCHKGEGLDRGCWQPPTPGLVTSKRGGGGWWGGRLRNWSRIGIIIWIKINMDIEIELRIGFQSSYSPFKSFSSSPSSCLMMRREGIGIQGGWRDGTQRNMGWCGLYMGITG